MTLFIKKKFYRRVLNQYCAHYSGNKHEQNAFKNNDDSKS